MALISPKSDSGLLTGSPWMVSRDPSVPELWRGSVNTFLCEDTCVEDLEENPEKKKRKIK